MAAQYGMIAFRGRGGRSFNKNVYFDDVAGALVRWDGGSGASATSPVGWTPPEHVVMVDLVLAAALVVTRTQLVRGGQPTGDILQNSVHLASVLSRPGLAIVIPAGVEVAAIQLA